MAIAANFSGIVAPRNTWGRKPTPKTAIESFAVKTTCRFDQDRLKREHLKFLRNAELSKLLINGHNKFYPTMASNRSTNNYHNSDPASTSPSDLIKDFYVCINEKNMRKLGDYISADCYIEECSFPSPIDGKEEVFRFFKRLSTSMGENVKFNVQHVCQEDDQLIAAAKWHMGFLKSPHVILNWLLKVYSIMLGLFINPVLKSYLHLWNFATLLQSYVFQFVLQILKHFLK
ncbi:hypothetical protein G4B88_000739 [Cannabis sativa]|uniref:SnoaL-like domain-containing protein n=1 Tax=Cannabis sativa TaxID=3483 RepID=A0A7J6I3R0_CANSA|nr:hypothetical protein G4B88_000739 [Cannabis sativa]